MLYLFAGPARRTSIKAVLERFSKQFASVCEVECEEWDICRGEEFDLLREDAQRSLLKRIEAGEFCAILMSPPCASWSRAPWANPWGPRPLRTALYPWGLPWLEGWRMEKVAKSNSMIRFCIRIIEMVAKMPLVKFLLEHPENLGATRSRPSWHIRPASIWELPEIQALVSGEVFTQAFHQCQFGAVSPKPTRIITSLPRLRHIGYPQWPNLDGKGRYLGPVPAQCACGQLHQRLIKKGSEDEFSTTKAAAYPEAMDLEIAWAIWQHAESIFSPCSSSPLGGGSVEEKGEKQGRRHKAEKVEETQTDKKRRVEGPPKAAPQEEAEEDETIGAETIGAEEVERLMGEAQNAAAGIQHDREGRGEESRRVDSQRIGKRAPLKVHYKGRIRDMCDGLGKCSPGIRPAGYRGEVAGKQAKRLRDAFWEEVEDLVEGMSKKERLQLMARLALGKFEDSPFKKDIAVRRQRMDKVLEELGYDSARRESDRCTAINFRRVQACAKILGDEDSLFLDGLAATGVPLGVRGEIPWVPEVYDRKGKGEKEEMGPQWCAEVGEEPRSNYGSAIAHKEKVRKIVEEEERKGWIKRVSLQKAREVHGSDVQVASLGAVPKDPAWEEVRVVHDGTHGIAVNSEIRQPNRMTFPQCDDVEAAAEALKNTGEKERMLFAFDIKAAHRLIPVQERDWPLQSFRLEEGDELFVNMVGTFGVASAAFWWGRTAAVIFRVFHRILPGRLLFYLMLFADDGLLMAMGKDYHKVVVALVLYLDLMEVPLSWRKTRGGFRVEWIGYTISLEDWTIGVSPKKVQWLVEWVERLIQQGHVLGREFKAGIGRLGFLAGALPGARPFLAQLYAVSARVGGSSFVELHLAVKLAIGFFAEWIKKEPMRALRSPPRVVGEVFRVDAAADMDGISIGGWEVYGGRQPREARWFAVKADRRSCPWLYLKGEPFRTIAAAELLAVTVAIMAFKDGAAWRRSEGRFSIGGFTDNSSNTFVVDKFLTTKFPVSLVLMELAFQLAQLEASLNLHWVPREQNEEADDLTKGRYDKFDEKRRIPIQLNEVGFEIIPKMAEVAGQLDEEIRLKKVSKEGKKDSDWKDRKTPAEMKLRMTQPW